MNRTRSAPPLARLFAAIIGIVAIASIALQIGLNMRGGEPIGDVVWGMLRFFTILTNLLVAGTFAGIAMGKPVAPRWLLCMASAIAGVGIVYHVALAPLLEHEGWEIVADQGVHSVVPVLTVLGFLACVPKGVLRLAHVPMVVIWPTLYCVYALVRGSVEGDYPYFFIDANTLGIGELVVNIAGLTLFFALLGLLLVLAAMQKRSAGSRTYDRARPAAE